MKVLITTTTFAQYDKKPLDLLKDNKIIYTLNPYKKALTEKEVKTLLEEGAYDGVVAGTEPLTKAVLENADKLKVISRVGVGLDGVDLSAAKELNIKVYNTPGILTDSVAELTLGLILSCLRKISLMDREMRSGQWRKKMGFLFKGKTIGIIGFGQIGKRVAQLAKVFGAKIIFYDVKNIKSKSFLKVSLPDLYKKSDIISIHSSAKAKLITKSAISKMKKDAILINTSRGSAVDEQDLYDGLKSGKICFAGLDVHSKEPYSGKLLKLDNIVFTPHVGSYAKEARIEMEIAAVKNLLKGFKQKI